MTELNIGETPLRNQIRKQVDRCGEVVKGDLEGVDSESVNKYVSRVIQSVRHLESLSEPYKDSRFEDQIEGLKEENNLDRHGKPKNKLEYASDRFTAIVQMLHRQGVL